MGFLRRKEKALDTGLAAVAKTNQEKHLGVEALKKHQGKKLRLEARRKFKEGEEIITIKGYAINVNSVNFWFSRQNNFCDGVVISWNQPEISSYEGLFTYSISLADSDEQIYVDKTFNIHKKEIKTHTLDYQI